MKDSKIEWTDSTFNPWVGCTKVSPGCTNCYAEALMDHRMRRVNWGKGNPRSRTSPDNWRKPIRWNREHDEFFAKHGRKRRVFCASLADWLDPEVSPRWLADLLGLIQQTPNLDWLLLTKRPELWWERIRAAGSAFSMCSIQDGLHHMACDWLSGSPPANVWVGCTVEDQKRADQRIPALLKIPARVRFLSCEPLLGLVDVLGVQAHTVDDCPIYYDRCLCVEVKIDWVICGGESGHGARPMHPDWARSLRDQCNEAGVAFHFKQHGAWRPQLVSVAGDPKPLATTGNWGTLNALGEYSPATTPWNGRQLEDSLDNEECVMVRVGKKRAGRLLDGRTWDEIPGQEVPA